MGGVPYAVARCATHSIALYQKGNGKRKEGAALLETVEESLPIGSEETERANRLSLDSYWRRVELWEVLKKDARKWNHQD